MKYTQYAYGKKFKTEPITKQILTYMAKKIRIGKHGFSKSSALLFAVIFAGIGTYIIVRSFAATSDVANLWVDQNGGACQRSGSQISYTGTADSNSCSSLQAACTAAASGDLVLIKSGPSAYSFSINNCKKTSMTTFRVPDDEDVTIGNMSVQNSDWITIDGGPQMALMTIGSDNNAGVFSKCANHLTLSHIEINGNGHDGDGYQIGWPNDCTSSYLTVDSTLIYGLVYKGGNHTDCIQAASSRDSFIIQNSRLMQCGDGAMQFTDGGDWGEYGPLTGLQNVKILNNWINNKINYGFGRMGSGDLLFQNNTYFGQSSTQFNNTSHQKIYGNIFYWYQDYDCSLAAQGGTYGGTADFKYNVSNVNCPGNTNSTKLSSPIASLFVNYGASLPQNKDLHLANSTNQAINKVPTGYYAATDMDGESRSGASADAGADEFGGVVAPPDTTNPTATLTAPANGAALSGASVTLSATASDDVSVSQVEFFVDGDSVGTDSDSPYSITWDSQTVANGSHTIQAKAYDPSGNVGNSSTRTITTNNTAVCSSSSNSWQNHSFSVQSSNFTFDFDATPSASNSDSVVGLSNGAASTYADLATAVRFNSTGAIDARNGGSYTAASTYNYTAGINYHFTVSVNMTNNTYTVKVTPAGGSETTLASNYAFRTEQASVSQLNSWAAFTTTGTLSVCGVAVAASGSSSTPPSPIGTPTITGTLRVSSNLSAGNTTWNGTAPITYTYQWQRCDSAGTSSSCATPTTPAGVNSTSSTYTLTCADYNKTLRLVIKGTNSSGNANATTAISTAVQKPSTPVLGDFDDNCYINATDISAFVAHWRLPVGTGTNNTYNISGPALGNPPDSLIDSWDLNLLVSHYGYGG